MRWLEYAMYATTGFYLLAMASATAALLLWCYITKPTTPKPCPLCHSKVDKALYMGLPIKLCSDPGCNCLHGLFWWVPVVFQIGDGGWYFLVYRGSYWRALWRFIKSGTTDLDVDER